MSSTPDPSLLGPAAPRSSALCIPLTSLRPLPETPTLEELRERLREVQAAKDAVSLTELPHTGARAKRNNARRDAWVALDFARDWLRFAVALWPHPSVLPFPPVTIAEVARSVRWCSVVHADREITLHVHTTPSERRAFERRAS